MPDADNSDAAFEKYWRDLQSRKEAEAARLLKAMKERLPSLKTLLAEVSGRWYEDTIYRFYHQSCKVYHHAQPSTQQIVAELQALAPHLKLNPNFEKIVAEGTGRIFHLSHNDDWLRQTRPMIEAFFHARYFLEMAVKYAEELSAPPQPMPSGWATLLYLFNLR
jgi:hypothetical protein